MEAIIVTLHDYLCKCFLNQKMSPNDGVILGRTQYMSALNHLG